MGRAFNKLTHAEIERLALLAEECGEVIQAVSKILRHGYESYNPLDTNKETNRTLLEKELGDLQEAKRIMLAADDIHDSNIKIYAQSKYERVKQYLHHN